MWASVRGRGGATRSTAVARAEHFKMSHNFTADRFRRSAASRYLDPKHLIGYLNMITSLISSGASCKSNGETAIGVSVSSLDKTRKTTTRRTHLRRSGNASEVVDKLEALLTGGRLGAATNQGGSALCLSCFGWSC